MRFIDEATIYIKSGNGGNGCLSFRRERNIPFGGPNGGNGGHGGHVFIEATSAFSTLLDFKYQQHYSAPNGRPGEGSNRTGADAEDLHIKVPVGTEVWSENQALLIADLTHEGASIRIAEGGKGGVGNAAFKSSINRAPRTVTPGWPGEEKAVVLSLKLLADVGLVGMPNAGKSSLLARISAARPKIADYPFTTLSPQLGVVEIYQNRLVVADIPGLIEGAHEGVGLGIEFLKHIERCQMLVHMIDGTMDDLVTLYEDIRHELGSYHESLAEKDTVVVINKADACVPEELEAKREALSRHIQGPVYSISAVTGEGVPALLQVIHQRFFPAVE